MNDSNRINVIHLTPRGATVVTLPSDLEAFQSLVGGYIECVTITPQVCIVCNDRGALDKLPVGWVINNIPIAGPCFLSLLGSPPDIKSEDGPDGPEIVGFELAAAEHLAALINMIPAEHGLRGIVFGDLNAIIRHSERQKTAN